MLCLEFTWERSHVKITQPSFYALVPKDLIELIKKFRFVQ